MSVMRQWWVAGLLAFCPAAMPAGGGQACAGCHPAEAKLHEQTRMAHAMTPAKESAFEQNLPDGLLRESGDGYQFTFQKTPTGVMMTARRGSDEARGELRWVMGAGVQGETPLVDAKNGELESRISYFPQLRQYGITIGQEAGASDSAESALGLPQSPKALRACVGCHATAVRANAEPAIPGVQCERCHAGAVEHAKNQGKVNNPGKLSPLDQARFCGSCHRMKAPVDDHQLENVRFQPLRLAISRCFTRFWRSSAALRAMRRIRMRGAATRCFTTVNAWGVTAERRAKELMPMRGRQETVSAVTCRMWSCIRR